MNRGAMSLYRTVSRPGYKLAAQVLFLMFVGGLVAVSRRYFDLRLGIPGHTGVLWMFLMVIGAGVVRRPGAGLVMGGSTALWGEVIGLDHGLVYNMVLYASVGLALDLVVGTFRLKLSNPLGGLAAGAVAHATKYGFLVGYALMQGVPKNIFVIGTATTLGYHVLFGAIGGFLGGVALWRLHRARLAARVP